MNDGKVRISVFPPDTPKNVVLTSNGHSLDRFCLKSEGFKDLAGNFRLEANFINSKERPEIEKGHIIKVLDEYDRDEIFRVTTFNPGLMVTELIAFQITITESQSVWLKDVRPTKTSGNVALNNMYSGADSFGFSKEMIVSSDITDISTAYYQKMTLFKAIYDCDQSFINRWGGETLRHQYNLSINKQIGKDNGVTIREGKNLLGFKANTNVDSLCTVAIGQGFDGIEGDYIASPLKDKYPRAYPKVIEYSDVKVRNESDANDEGFATLEEAKEELNRRIKEEFSKNHIDEVKATYDIEFLQLEKTEEYKNYAGVEISDLGDIIRVYVSSLGLTLTTRVVEKTVNYLNGNVLKTKLSNNPVDVVKSDSQILADIRKTFVKNNNSNLGGYIDAMIRAGLKNSFVINKENETYWLDNKDINLAKNIVRINKNGLACSQNGINGTFEYGITIDGKINASMIVTGILSTILITNADNSFEIDLSGTGGASFKNNGKMAMRIENNMVKMYNWAKNGDYIGGLMSLCNNSDPDKPIVALGNDLDSACMITYHKEGTITHPAYIAFDKFNILKDKNEKPIRVYEDVDFRGNKVYNIDIRSDNGKNNIMVGDHFINITTPDNEIVVSGSGTRIGKDKSLYYDARTGELRCNDLVLNGVIKNTSGNLVLDPNAPQGGGVDGSDSLRSSVVNSARKLIGKPYVWGGNYPPLGSDVGTDCSGLMQWSYHDNGITLSRTTYTQINEGFEVKENELKPGDLIFMHFTAPNTPQHVFMYSGEKDGQHMCVEAPRTGLNIRERAFTWGSDYRARRIIKDTQGGNVNGTAGTKASKNIIYYVKGIEGYAPYVYRDEVGVRTLGYGMTGSELSGVSVPLSETSATHYLVNNFNRLYYVPVLNILKAKGVTNMLQREVDAFASFAYNCGVDGFKGSQLLAKYVAGERGESIHNEFKKWVHGGGQVLPGLVRRREEEWKIFSGSSSPVGGYNTTPSISYIGTNGLQTGRVVTENGGYGASPY